MVCYQFVMSIRFCGHERGAWKEDTWHEKYPGKRTQKYSKDDKESL